MNPLAILKHLLHDNDPKLRLAEALELRGAALPTAADEFNLRAAALATRRCVACRQHAHCDELLAKRDWEALRDICPSAGYIEALPQDSKKGT